MLYNICYPQILYGRRATLLRLGFFFFSKLPSQGGHWHQFLREQICSWQSLALKDVHHIRGMWPGQDTCHAMTLPVPINFLGMQLVVEKNPLPESHHLCMLDCIAACDSCLDKTKRPLPPCWELERHLHCCPFTIVSCRLLDHGHPLDLLSFTSIRSTNPPLSHIESSFTSSSIISSNMAPSCIDSLPDNVAKEASSYSEASLDFCYERLLKSSCLSFFLLNLSLLHQIFPSSQMAFSNVLYSFCYVQQRIESCYSSPTRTWTNKIFYSHFVRYNKGRECAIHPFSLSLGCFCFSSVYRILYMPLHE